MKPRGLCSLLALGVALSACEGACSGEGAPRGCARQTSPESPPAAGSGRAFGLSGTDCAPGVGRCLRGIVEVSVAGFVPHPCQGAACACPWTHAATCRHGCVAEGIEIGTEADAAPQLCAPSPAAVVYRPPLVGDPPVPTCAWSGARCVEGVVAVCDRPSGTSRVLGVCLHGCAAPAPVVDEAVMDELKTPVGAAAILCRHDHAERQ